ncbi:MAG: hypothetical protein NVS2B9_17930 [Myxococcales bacterium]
MGSLIAGIAGLAATLLAAPRSESVDLLRFPLCWGSILIALRGGVRLRHGREALPPTGELGLLALGSVAFWDLFELLNLRLHDWWYVGVPRDAWAGALFSAASFATVLPAARLSEILLRPAPRGSRPGAPRASPASRGRAGRLALSGVACLGCALAAPRLAFPLAWIFLLPLCEAALCRWPASPADLPGPLEALREGDRGPALRLLALGLPIGLAWEALNAGCARGWVYTVPGFEGAKIFEMPAPGYLGYLPFLLEAGAANALLLRARDRWRPGLSGTAVLLALLAAFHIAIDGAGRAGTAISVAQRFDDASELPFAGGLAAAGIDTPRALLATLARDGVGAVAVRAGLSAAQVEDAGRTAALAQVARLGLGWAARLERAGVRTPAGLAGADLVRLRSRLAADLAVDLRADRRARGGPTAGGDDGSGAPREELVRLWMTSAARVSR